MKKSAHARCELIQPAVEKPTSFKHELSMISYEDRKKFNKIFAYHRY